MGMPEIRVCRKVMFMWLFGLLNALAWPRPRLFDFLSSMLELLASSRDAMDCRRQVHAVHLLQVVGGHSQHLPA